MEVCVFSRKFVGGSGVFFTGLLSLVSGVLLGATAWAAGTPDNAATHATVYGTVWGQTLAQDGSGFYNDIATDMFEDGEGAVDYRLMPYRRARSRFLNSQSACLYPSARSILDAGGHTRADQSILESEPLFAASVHLFAGAGEQVPSSLKDLAGRTVAVPSGSVALRLLKGTGAKLIAANDEADKAQMLLTGRVELMSGMLPNEHIVFSHMGARLPAYDRDFALLDAGVSVVCHDTPANRAFIERLNARVAVLHQDRLFQAKLAAAGLMEAPLADAADAAALNAIAPAAGGRTVRFVHPGRRLPINSNR